MKSLNKPQQQELKVNLEGFLDKVLSLKKLLNSSYKLSNETRENIEWYYNYKVNQYHQRYLSYLKEKRTRKKDLVDKSY